MAAAARGASADTDGAAVSALADNIASKGESSYYYAHKPRDTALPAGTLAFGGDPVPIAGDAAAAAAEAARERVVTLERYAWADSGKTIKVYIEADALFGGSEAVRSAWAAANGGSDELAGLSVDGEGPAVGLDWSERSVVLEVRLPGVDDVSGARPVVRRLRLDPLFDSITAAKARPKKSRIILVLTKRAASVTWRTIKE